MTETDSNTDLFFFSIIVCCYNSSKLIESTLKYISRLVFDANAYPFEIIIVDNNSNDDTVSKADHVWRKINSQIPFKIVRESKQGLSFARNRGVSESKGTYIVFCDDDNWLQPGYLKEAYHILKSDAMIGMLGGVGEPESDAALPDWFDSHSLAYAVGKQHKADADISKIKGYVYGAGCIIKKSLILELSRIGFKNVLTDRLKRNSITGGGDNELGYAVVILGYKVFYSENLKFKHFISKNRLTRKYLTKFKKGSIYTSTAVKTYERYVFSNDLSYQKLTYCNSVGKNIKDIIKISRDFIFSKITFFNYAILLAVYFNRMVYYFKCRKYDIEIFKKVKSNIELIEKYKNG
ncbi:MAG TPA: glycosyltransferase [Flavobacterium sp.]|nr:glycosyltransferase [Flavobacterium sp.]